MKICPLCKRTWEDAYRVCPIDGLALEDSGEATDPNARKPLGNLQLGDKLADGALGPIYRAVDPARGPVAVQIVNPDLLASEVLKESFQEAVKLSTRLQHAHIVKVFGIEAAPDGGLAVVMELVAGANLATHRQERQVPVAQACQMARQAGEALVAAHRVGVMHGALHPSRILVASDGSIKV